MKTLYRIETRKYKVTKKDNTPVAEKWKMLMEIKKKVGETGVLFRRAKLSIPSGISYAIQDLKNELMAGSPTEKILVRETRIKKYKVSLDEFDGSSYVQKLRRGLDRIKSDIRHDRVYRRAYSQEDNVHMFSGEIIARAFGKALQNYKAPKTNNRHIGIEIECIIPRGAEYMKELYPFREFVSVSGDGSITNYKENEQGLEVKIIGERGKIDDTIRGVCEAITKLGGRVNTSCGLHVHLDCRDAVVKEDEIKRFFSNLYACQSRLLDIVPPSRKKNTYCRRNRTKDYFAACQQNRYRIINMSALRRHNTIEIRLFGGTLQADKVINWYQTLVAIAEAPALTAVPRTWKSLGMKVGLKSDIVQWAMMRKKTIGNPETGEGIEQNLVAQNQGGQNV